jgi:SpoVK/Ycf46/Vps4 family AAA+-type ATPase
MILTTNRRKDFDEAFESRIHVSIHYDLPDVNQRLAIWQNQLRNMNHSISAFGEDNLAYLAQRYKLNGREIKNLFSTARALVEGSGEQVQLKDIERLYRINNPREDLLSRRSTEGRPPSRANTI